MRNTRTAKRSATTVRGTYLLEAAFVCFGIVSVAVAVHDVASIFRARNTVRAAVREGLRCMYPTDANCLSSTGRNATALEKRYDVWTRKSGYFVPQDTYKAYAGWNDEPRLAVNVDEKRLSAINVKTAPSGAQRKRAQVPVDLHTEFLVQTSDRPQVRGRDVRHPNFVDSRGSQRYPDVILPLSSRDKDGDYKGVLLVAGGSLSGTRFNGDPSTASRLSGKSEDSVSFPVHAVKDARGLPVQVAPKIKDIKLKGGSPVLNCYQHGYPEWRERVKHGCVMGASNPTMSDTTVVATQNDPNTRRVANEVTVPVMIWITGDAFGSNTSALGAVELWYNIDSGKWINLGGQTISGDEPGMKARTIPDPDDRLKGGDRNFIVRGAGYEDIRESDRSNYADYPEPGKYPVIWVPDGSTVGIRFQIQNRKNKTGVEEQIAWQGYHLFAYYPTFTYSEDKHECQYGDAPNVCQVPPTDGRPWSFLEMGAGAPRTIDVGDVECRTNLPSEEVVPAGQAAATVAAMVANANGQWPQEYREEVETAACVPPSRRFGDCVSELLGAKYVGCLTEHKSRQLSEEELFSLCSVPAELRTPGSVLSTETKDSQVEERYLGCSEHSSVPECAVRTEVERVVWVPKKDEDLEACKLDKSHTSTPMIAGPIDRDLCKDPQSVVRERYQREYGGTFPAAAVIKVDTLPTSPEERYYGPQPPPTCIVSTRRDDAEALCGKRLSQAGAAQCCADANGKCRMNETVANYTGINRGYTSPIEGARERALELITNTYPRLQTEGFDGGGSCDGSSLECLASLQGGFTRDNTRAQLSASITLPLLMNRILQKESYTVQHQEERILERALIE